VDLQVLSSRVGIGLKLCDLGWAGAQVGAGNNRR
jgi:hypothetical protein